MPEPTTKPHRSCLILTSLRILMTYFGVEKVVTLRFPIVSAPVSLELLPGFDLFELPAIVVYYHFYSPILRHNCVPQAIALLDPDADFLPLFSVEFDHFHLSRSHQYHRIQAIAFLLPSTALNNHPQKTLTDSSDFGPL